MAAAIYCHTAHLMKQDGATRRKLSKRKDPELGLDYYRSLGYHPQAVREYLMTILNSNYEEWRLANPHTPSTEFNVTMEKMGKSGALFDLDKLNDIAKDVRAEMSAADIYEFLLGLGEGPQARGLSGIGPRAADGRGTFGYRPQRG